MAKVLIIVTNYGSWAEELQAPWDACKKAGFEVTLATPQGKKPLPFKISIDPDLSTPCKTSRRIRLKFAHAAKNLLTATNGRIRKNSTKSI